MTSLRDEASRLADQSIADYKERYDFPWQGESHMHDCVESALLAFAKLVLEQFPVVPMPHYECEDCWYSCATITCDENRLSEICDCGADEENKRRAMTSELLRELEK